MKGLVKGLKKVLGLALVMTLVVGAAGCSKSDNAADGDKSAKAEQSVLDTIKKKGTLVVGTSAEYPPFEFHYVGDGKDEIVGYDIDIAKEIAKDLGVKLDVKDMDFDALLPALNAGEVDMVIAGVTPTDERKQSVDFSDIYYTGKNSVIIRKGDDAKVKSEDDLKKLKIGVQKGSTQEIFVNDKLKAEKVTSLAQTPDLMMELKNKNVDAVVSNDSVAMINVKKYDGIKLADNQVKGENADEQMAIAIKKGDNKAFIDEMNKIIKKINDSDLGKKYMEEATDLASKVK